MAPKKTAPAVSPSPIAIGNCKVTVDARNFSFESHPNSLQISVSRSAKINISVREEIINRKNDDDNTRLIKSGETEELERDHSHEDEFLFVLVNPKDVNHSTKSHLQWVLQEVLKLYTRELPTMNFAANTGKQSMFLERCVMNGKYCTLLLKSPGEVIAAITYQIVPADTQYAEIPLAAVSSIYQHKGFGCFLFMELRKRLQSVGICTIFCWGDKESEGFWHKQGFVSVAEVDTKGRARRLPIKADIRRALCFPGGSTLMVSHLNRDISANSTYPLKTGFPLKPNGKYLPAAAVEIKYPALSKDGYSNIDPPKQITSVSENSQPVGSIKNHVLSGERNKLDGSLCLVEIQGYRNSVPFAGGNSDKLVTGMELSLPVNCEESGHENTSGRLEETVQETGADFDSKYFSFPTQDSRAKRRVWESSLSSLKSKKVKGSHLVGCHCGSNCDIVCESDGYYSCFQRCTLDGSKNDKLVGLPPINTLTGSSEEKIAQGCDAGNLTTEAPIRKEFHSQRQCYKIMLMNIADDTKKAHLTKVIEDLGGSVTSDGNTCTHVITGKVRKTLNFCTALCSGAWIISACWLKESFRQGRFVDELPYLLNDEEYAAKYRTEMRAAVLKAKESPGALLKGYNVCIATHVQPPARTLSAIVKSAGGDVIGGLKKVKEPSRTIFVACEEDMEEARFAVKKGIWTFSSDWLMNCVMSQELDLEAPQFAESL
ncbi:uncharacterized protein LOC107431598 isoform X1 [Ziziphus jujuba]|uniref:Uncharacterized protein LOC107431598 isoform X1 n=1 Tax=Ziziphus jujuba TaxID=326968 RepID=A0A6P6FKN1_ZIZJJ|nr:uncharacterized protein LOC107431598 isoform X1 [Ziziphus jujuba]